MPSKRPLDSAVSSFSRDYLMPAIAGSGWQNAVNLAPSLTLVKGDQLAEITASPGIFSKYASGASDGTQLPTALCPFACTTDSNGNILPGGAADPAGSTMLSIDAWFGGVFLTTDIATTPAATLGKALSSKLYKLNG